MQRILIVSESEFSVNGAGNVEVIKVSNAHNGIIAFDNHPKEIILVIIDSGITWWGKEPKRRVGNPAPGCARFIEHLESPINRIGMAKGLFNVFVVCPNRCGLCSYTPIKKEEVPRVVSDFSGCKNPA